MRGMSIGLVIAVIVFGFVNLGCGTPSGGGQESASSETTTHDGLVLVETEGPGKLFLRKDHGIGGYDAIVVVPSFVTYQRGSTRLDPDLEEVYLVSLEQALVDAAEAANVPIVYEAGDCVIKVGVGFVNVGLARSSTAEVLGEMTLVFEYRDSMSDESLLRYAADEKITREANGTSREDQVRASFDKMIDDIDIIHILRGATKVASKPRPGCEGKLVHVGAPSA